MEVKLVVVGGKNPGQQIPVRGAKFFVGRAEDCHLRPQSALVSRRHCAILAEEGLVTVRDFGSKNGTFVNGERVKTERELKAGDRLKIGPLELEVQLAVSVGGAKKPKVHSVQEAAARTVQAAAGDDIDISQWLEDDDEDEETASTAATADTTEVVADPAAAGPAASGESSEEAPDDKGKDTKVVGRFGSAKAKAASSRSAAADMLEQFFGGSK
jgi:pSer/pThr/pTyr-binding forkhead associated (FHA) protein